MIRLRAASSSPHCSSSRARTLAVRRQPVEPLGPPVLLAPLAVQQALGLEPAQQRVERVLLDVHPLLAERLAKRIAVVLGPQLSEHRDDDGASTQLETQVLEAVVRGGSGALAVGMFDT